MRDMTKIQNLIYILKENFGELCEYNIKENTIYYKEGVDLNELFKVITGYKVYVQLRLL